MAILNPNSDVSVGVWTDQSDLQSNIYVHLGDSSTATWVQAEAVPLGGDPELPYTFGLAAGTDPGINDGHEIHISVRFVGGTEVPAHTMRVELIQGTSTVIDTFTISLAPGSSQEHVRACSSAVIANITDYSTLRGRVTLLPDTSAWTCEVREFSFRPPTTFEHLDLNPSGPGFVVAAPGSGNYLILDGPGLKRVSGLEVSGALIPDSSNAGWKVYS